MPAYNSLYLGFDEKGKILSYHGDRHVVIVGANGTGKSNRVGVPNLLRSYGRSWVVVDIKPELGPLTARARQRYGDVVVLDPFNKTGLGSTGFNPLAGLDPASPSFNSDAALIADALVVMEGEERDPHWSESARVLISWLCMFEAYQAREEGRPPLLRNVRAVLGETASGPTEANEEGSGIVREAFAACRTDIEAIYNKAGQFKDFTKEIGSILSTATRHTAFLDDVEMARDLSGSFDFSDLKRKPQTVYLTLPAKLLNRHKSWLRLALSAALRACLDDGPVAGVPVVFFLDEFAALGRLSIIENVWALVRGYGLQIIPVLQDLGQLKKLYGERWESFIGNAGAAIFFTPGDSLTAKWISERMGQQMVLMPSYSAGQNPNNAGVGVSYGHKLMPAMSPYQLYGMEQGTGVMFLAGLSQAVVTGLPWWADVPKWRALALG
jgi:type IV secretion system protein VirD4